MSSRAWVTLATNDSYGLGALVLAHSLRRAGSVYPAVVLITPSVTDAMRERLRGVFAEVVTVDVLDSGDAAHLALLQRPELGITFTKIHCWNLTQYEKCVFLDADTLVVQNCDELFEREELSAAPDVGWPDCFNSGVFVYKPSAETFSALINFAQERGSFDGGDQGLLNSYFSDWAHGDIGKHLPFLYNVTSAAFYSYLPALKHYGQNLKIIHFIGAAKPWLQQFNWESRSVDAPEHLKELLQLWWDLFVSQVHPQLDTTMVEVEDAPSAIPPPQETVFRTEPRSDYNHYKPVLDPESEFLWHRPEAQIPDPDIIVPTIDMSQFHDPWDIYQGYIRPITEDTKSTCSHQQVLQEQQEIRRHVWECPPSQFQPISEPNYTEMHHYNTSYNQSVVETSDSTRHYNNSHHNERYCDIVPQQEAHYNEIHHNTISQNLTPNITSHDNGSHHHEYHYTPHHHESLHIHSQSKNEYQSEAHNTEIHQEQNLQNTYTHSDSAQLYDIYEKQQSESYHNHNKEIESLSNHNFDQRSIHNYADSNYPDASTDSNNRSYHTYDISQNSDRFKSQSIDQQHSTVAESYSNNQHEHPLPLQYRNEETYSTHEDLHNRNTTYKNDIYPTHINNSVHDSVLHLNQCQVDSTHLQKQSESFIHSLRNKIEYVYCLHLDHERERNRQKDRGAKAQKNVNGFVSESETDEFDDFIIPRHPYDGFYLRHRMTIDSRGRKICTHEIPPTPSPSPSISPPESPIFFDAVSEFSSPEDTFSESIDHGHSGVAGNLARVSPGAVGTQREALDELTRRQGWEAGNIDYMGADSFANIWAKISQTLSQPPASPPKEPTPPPKELDLPQVEPTEPKESEISSPPVIDEQKLESPVVPEQQKVIPLTEEEPNKVEAPADVVTPPGVSAPADASIQSVELAPSESSLPPKTEEMPVEAATPEPAAAPIDSESQKSQPSLPGTEVAPAETIIEASEPPTTDVAVSEDATIPVETAAIPVESSVPELPAEIPVPVVEAVLAEAQAPLEAAPLKPEEVPAPVIEASSPEILNVESKAEAVIGDVQEKKSDEVSKTVDEAPKEESPKEVPEPAPSVAPQELVTVAGVEAPAAASDVVGTPPRPEGISVAAATDSPPLANTPSKEEIPAEPAAKTEERRKPAGKLQLRPPAAADPLPTPDSELEDAATLAQSIIASELRTPTVTSPTPQTPASPAQPKQEKRLSVEDPQPPTPPLGSVSLSQIGVKAAKGKSTIAAQIESSVSDKPAPTSPTTEPKAPTEAPKKKVVKKVLKKDSAASGEAPVPPPRKKEKKPKEK
ncbi:uncharacterized protein [Battus philenor]|uniref:uncharacterized protein isoform X1 n=1 Tax=Battus philenor TaxID=42288 RepID=UPI0035CF53D1